MPKIRVLVVDDSVVTRKLVSEAVGRDPACEVVGTAANGRIALAKITQVNPDIVTLDVEMPEMDGLAALAEIRKTNPRLPVIMFSAQTELAADATLKALSLGANDYVTKPSASNFAEALRQVQDQLLPKIRCFVTGPATAGFAASSGAFKAAKDHGPSPVPAGRTRLEVVAIGVSTGGPNALAALLPKIPASFPAPIVITQHMPPVFTRLLAERLGATSPLRVREAAGGEILEAGHVFLAPGDSHLVVRREGTVVRLSLDQGPQENSCRPAVDVMFRSVVQAYGARTLAVVLTGMGQDGLRGCEHVREAGGQIVVQDQASSVVWGMPGFVAKAGLADAIVPLEDLDLEIVRRVGRTLSPSGSASNRPPSPRMRHGH
jgi:two-component system chemotaxis response regulator CheB